MECNASQLLNIKTKTWNTVTISLGIFLFWNPYLAEFSYPKKQENVWPHSSNSIKNQPHNSQYRGENATPFSGILQGSDLLPLQEVYSKQVPFVIGNIYYPLWKRFDFF